MKLYVNSRIVVEGGGSRVGLAGVIEGSARVAVVSKDLDSEEQRFFTDAGLKPSTFKIAVDAVALIVNPRNPVEALSVSEARDIFAGRVTNWSEVQGSRLPILPVVQNPNSGTRRWFQQAVMGGGHYTARAYQVNTVAEVLLTVKERREAAGVVSIARADSSVKVLPIALESGRGLVEPSAATLLDRSYPLARPIILVTAGEAEGLASGFISYITSTAGQRIVADEGYLPATVPVTIRMP
jgi:phosphate transport system substrate-binding protein